MTGRYEPAAFISEEIEVEFEGEPVLLKKPGAPARFVWRGESHPIAELISSWTDFERKGRMAKNMQEHHLRVARERGSWGVGRFYFRVATASGRVFDLYYDRAPEAADDRTGHWFLWRELRMLKE